MASSMVRPWLTWAEDRATAGTDPSADPGAKTEGRAATPRQTVPPPRQECHPCEESPGTWSRSHRLPEPRFAHEFC